MLTGFAGARTVSPLAPGLSRYSLPGADPGLVALRPE